jgi:ATP-binding cassette subfamily B multidrug efflux pump
MAKSILSALRRPLGYLRFHPFEAGGAFLSLLIVLVASLVVPWLIRLAVDDGLAAHQTAVLTLAVAGIVGAALLRGVFSFLQGYLSERASQGVAFALREDLFAKIQRLSFSYYDSTETGQVLTRLTNDVDQVRTFIGSGVIQIAQSLVMLVLSVVLILLLDWRLALVTLTTVVPILFIMGNFVRTIGPLFGKIQHHLSSLNSILREDLTGARTIRAFGRQTFELGRYSAVNQALLEQNLEATRAGSNNFPLIMFFASLGTLAVIGFGGWEATRGWITIGTILAFISYLGFLLQPLIMLGFSAMMVTRAGVSASRIAEIFDAPLDILEKPDAMVLPPLSGAFAFESVSFRYPGGERDILQGLSFSVSAGETVALVGTTGSGKSTLVHLLPRFYDVTAGAVRVDGYDVREVTLASLRSQIGIVLQEPLLFGGTVAQNIAYGKPEATEAEIEAAAKSAHAEEFIKDLPQAYETVIGERGVGLSGGQRQRIAIARALLVSPRLLILDDSTSAVDAETEAVIQASLDALMREGGRTCVVIAQRFSTVRDADRVLVLDKGKLLAQGTHLELMENCPSYQDILGLQLTLLPGETP